MSTAPASDGAVGRRIGDILLEHGFVNESQLAAATEEQERTKQPLGQILVQHGAITRLELASALAEQWSDPSASITVLPRPTAAARPVGQPQPHDDAQYAARLQEAVADLARRVQANEPLEGIDERINDLGQRTEATLARTQRLEATVATLVERLEGVTDGVEEAFAAFQGGTAGLAADLARIDAAVAEIAASPAGREHEQASLEELDELRSAVARLEGKPDGLAAFEALREAVDELAQRPIEVPEVEARLLQLEARLEHAAEGVSDGALNELREAIVRLEEKPDGLAPFEARLDELAARLEGGTDPAAVEALRQAIDELASRPEDTDRVSSEALEELASAVGRLEEQPERISGLERRVGELAERLENVVDPEAIDSLRHVVDELASRSEDTDRVSPEAVDELRQAIERLQGQAETLAGLENRVGDLAARFDHVADIGSVESLRTTVNELVSRPVEHAELESRLDHIAAIVGGKADAVAVDAATGRLDEIGELLAELQARPDGDPELDARLEAIEANLELVAAGTTPPDPELIDGLVRNVEQAADTQAQLAESVSAIGARIDELAAQVPRIDEAVLRVAEVEGTAAAGVAGIRSDLVVYVSEALDDARASLSGDLDALRLQVEEAASRGVGEEDGGAVAALSERLDELAAQIPESTPAPDVRVDDLVRGIETLETEVADLRARPTVDETFHERIEALAARIEELDIEDHRRADVAGRLETIERQRQADAETIDVLLLALDRIREELSERAQETPVDVPAEPDVHVEERLGALESLAPRLEELSREFATRFEEVAASMSSAHDSTGVLEQLERVRLSIERFGLHLGEHDRAIADLTAHRGLEDRVEELAAKVEGLAAGGMPTSAPVQTAPAASSDVLSIIRRVEEAEAASQADREKLMSRLERMGSSIDWRLQRLEATDPE